MIRKEINREVAERYIPEDYQGRIELILSSKLNFYAPPDFEAGLEILLYFSRATGRNSNPDTIRRCRVVDADAKKVKSGFGMRDALAVNVSGAWIIRGGELEREEIKKPNVKFFYERIKSVYSVLE